jgi:hypothetical protein
MAANIDPAKITPDWGESSVEIEGKGTKTELTLEEITSPSKTVLIRLKGPIEANAVDFIVDKLKLLSDSGFDWLVMDLKECPAMGEGWKKLAGFRENLRSQGGDLIFIEAQDEVCGETTEYFDSFQFELEFTDAARYIIVERSQ